MATEAEVVRDTVGPKETLDEYPQDSQIEIIDNAQGRALVQLGSLAVARGPVAMLETASEIATVLADMIRKQGLASQISGKYYVRVEGWTTLGALLGVTPREVEVVELGNVDGSGAHYETSKATVELVRVSDGAIIGRASALCGTDESRWRSADRYARFSMALTRATSKAFRLSFSWIMALAGYEVTPYEEMLGVEDKRSATGANGNGGNKVAGNATTQFWARVNAAGISREAALDMVEASNSDFGAALQLLEQGLDGAALKTESE